MYLQRNLFYLYVEEKARKAKMMNHANNYRQIVR